MDNQYILVAGCTGVGKSAVVEFLHSRYYGSVYYSDPFVDNPFLKLSYVQAGNKSFQSEIFFIKEFLKIHKEINSIQNKCIFQERSLYECVYIFCRLFLLQSKIDKDEYQLCLDLLNELSPGLRMPDIIIYLTADPAIVLNRIAARGRSFEKDINMDFIKLQQSLYEDWLYRQMSKYQIPIIKIDNGNLDIRFTNQKILALL